MDKSLLNNLFSQAEPVNGPNDDEPSKEQGDRTAAGEEPKVLSETSSAASGEGDILMKLYLTVTDYFDLIIRIACYEQHLTLALKYFPEDSAVLINL